MLNKVCLDDKIGCLNKKKSLLYTKAKNFKISIYNFFFVKKI